jgi:hypothetical protein
MMGIAWCGTGAAKKVSLEIDHPDVAHALSAMPHTIAPWGGQFCPQPAFQPASGRLTGGCGHDWPPQINAESSLCQKVCGFALSACRDPTLAVAAGVARVTRELGPRDTAAWEPEPAPHKKRTGPKACPFCQRKPAVLENYLGAQLDVAIPAEAAGNQAARATPGGATIDVGIARVDPVIGMVERVISFQPEL